MTALRVQIPQVVRLPKKDAAKGGERRGEGLTDLAPSDETAGIEDERSGATGSLAPQFKFPIPAEIWESE